MVPFLLLRYLGYGSFGTRTARSSLIATHRGWPSSTRLTALNNGFHLRLRLCSHFILYCFLFVATFPSQCERCGEKTSF